MNWLYYLLEANLYLAAFYLIYRVLLQNSTFYNSNRYFLLLSIVVAFATPLIQLGFLKPQVVLEADLALHELPVITNKIAKVSLAPTLTVEDYIFYGYLVLASLLSLRFLIAISKIISIYAKGGKRKLGGYTLVELTTEHTAFSFFNVVFIHPNMAKNNLVLRHEIIHIQQKHSWDIVLLEFLKIGCWFNPIIYLIRKDLTLLHEYIADEQTISSEVSKYEYAMFLIQNSMASCSPSLVNQFFNQSILKSRIKMLNQEKTANWARLKYLLAVPLGLGLLCTSTLSFSKTYGYDVFPVPQKVTDDRAKQEKKTYYPKYKHDKNGNYISLEERLIVVNGKIIVDKNKYYGTAEADQIVFLNSNDAIKKYGIEHGKNGAVELYGEKAAFTSPLPIVKSGMAKNSSTIPSPPPIIQAPPGHKKLKKFPPPVVKPNQKTETISLNEDKVLEIEVVPESNQKDVVVEGYKKTEKGKLEILKKEIEVAELSLAKNKIAQEIEVIPTKKVRGNKIEKKIAEEVVVKGYKAPTQKVEVLKIKEANKLDLKLDPAVRQKAESLELVPTKKVQGLKITPMKTLNQTGAIKNNIKNKQEITTTKTALPKTNNIFNKAWTLYKPKVEENKNDRC